MIEGSLEVKLPTIWTDEKQRWEESERRERVRRKKMQVREKVGKSRNTVFFQVSSLNSLWERGEPRAALLLMKAQAFPPSTTLNG
jgi:hypothetical protein